MQTSDLELVAFVAGLPEGSSPTRDQPVVRQSVRVRHVFRCEACDIDESDTAHVVHWRGRFGRRKRLDVLESQLHPVREHQGRLPPETVEALSPLHTGRR